MKLFTKLFSGKEISGKAWVISTLIGVGLVLLFLGCMNFFIDPFAYFRFTDGEFSEFQDSEDSYLRYIKAKQIQYADDKYDAYIVGGSKAGALNPEVAGELDGHTYYNSWILSGNTHEYLLYTQYILDHTNATKILLHLSGPEIRKADRSGLGDLYKTPAVITDGDEVGEFIEFLGKNISFAWEDMTDMISGDYSISNPGFENGMRNVNYRYAKVKKDPEGYINTAVLHDYDTNLKKLFTVTPKNKAVTESLEDLKLIKKLDGTRPVHYESVHKLDDTPDDVLDVVSRMYSSVEDIKKFLTQEDEKRPFILCEYCHAMGNGPGDLEDYHEVFMSSDRLCGGLVWEWADHAVILGRTADGKVKYGYGGDSGERHHDNNFCMDALCYPDRRPHTGLKE